MRAAGQGAGIECILQFDLGEQGFWPKSTANPVVAKVISIVPASMIDATAEPSRSIREVRGSSSFAMISLSRIRWWG